MRKLLRLYIIFDQGDDPMYPDLFSSERLSDANCSIQFTGISRKLTYRDAWYALGAIATTLLTAFEGNASTFVLINKYNYAAGVIETVGSVFVKP